MNSPIIVALDVASAEEARALVATLGDTISFYKVGLELYSAAGMDFVRELAGTGKDVFLDLKFYDIPETVKRGVAQMARSGARFLTVHGVGEVMKAAIEGRGNSALSLLAVTVLTSFDQEELAQLGYPCPLEELVALRARNAMASGMDGLVVSAREVADVRALAGPGLILVTPGVRSATAERGDQKRVATPVEAIRRGANFVVIGREITRARDPLAEARRILEEISELPVAKSPATR